MRVAIVGGGISGLACAYLLRERHDVSLFESEPRLGGHSNTVCVEHEGRTIDVDTGFIVYNERNYPLFCRLLARLGIEGKDAPMSFGVRDDRTGLEYGGASLNALFCQRRNLLSPRFLGMVREILRFSREAPASLAREAEDATLGGYLERRGYGAAFVGQFLVPMGAAIWSSPSSQMRDFPLHFFVRFFENHGMLTPRDRPQWRTIPGGSRRYVDAIGRALGERVRAGCRVAGVRRFRDRVEVRHEHGLESFDEVILACHSDQALTMLEDPTPCEQEILGAIPYQANDTVLHRDQSVMPRNRRAWSAWNGRVTRDETERVVVTYDLTVLQSLGTRGTREHLLVSLNQTGEIDPETILARFTYDHPVFTLAGERAKERYDQIGGTRRTHFCGAYWFNGFHEDGMRSALRVCERLGVSL